MVVILDYFNAGHPPANNREKQLLLTDRRLWLERNMKIIVFNCEPFSHWKLLSFVCGSGHHFWTIQKLMIRPDIIKVFQGFTVFLSIADTSTCWSYDSVLIAVEDLKIILFTICWSHDYGLIDVDDLRMMLFSTVLIFLVSKHRTSIIEVIFDFHCSKWNIPWKRFVPVKFLVCRRIFLYLF